MRKVTEAVMSISRIRQCPLSRHTHAHALSTIHGTHMYRSLADRIMITSYKTRPQLLEKFHSTRDDKTSPARVQVFGYSVMMMIIISSSSNCLYQLDSDELCWTRTTGWLNSMSCLGGMDHRAAIAMQAASWSQLESNEHHFHRIHPGGGRATQLGGMSRVGQRQLFGLIRQQSDEFDQVYSLPWTTRAKSNADGFKLIASDGRVLKAFFRNAHPQLMKLHQTINWYGGRKHSVFSVMCQRKNRAISGRPITGRLQSTTSHPEEWRKRLGVLLQLNVKYAVTD